ncbi:MAG: glycosyl hydrolase [Candidatus Micrarchaeia archaeon]
MAVIAAVVAYYLSAQSSAEAQLPARINYVLGVGTHGNQTSELAALRAGVKYFRTDISLGSSQESWLDYEHNNYGAHYLGILDYETLPGGSSNRNWTLAQWNESVKEAVEAYPWITEWEIWNEPLVPQFQTGFMNGNPYHYFLMIKSAANEIRAVQPNATIVCFGGAPVYDEQAYLWYAEVWQYGAANYCNAVSVHAYLSAPLAPGENFTNAWAQGLDAYETLTHKPIYITEFGMPASSEVIPGYSESMQNEFLEESLALFARLGFVKQAYWYDLWGLSDGALGNNYGLLNLTNPSNGTPNLAWHTFLQAYNESASKA